MTAPPKERAAPDAGRVGSKKISGLGETTDRKDSLSRVEPQALRSWADLDHRTEQLTAVADYQQQLLVKIRWAQLKQELGMYVDEFDDIVSEAAEFKEICRALSAPSDGRGAP
jgi:hypothetical protein